MMLACSSEPTMILVIAEQRDGTLNRASWEAIAAAQQLGGPVTVVVPGASVAGAAAELAAADVAGVIALEHEALGTYTPDGFVGALAALITAESPSHVVLPHTYQTRDFAPKLAARLNAPLAADCVGLKSGDAGDAGHVYVRLMFQGKVSADVVLVGDGAAHCDVSDRRVSRGRGQTRRRAGARSASRGNRRCLDDPAEARSTISRGEAGGGSHPGRAHCLGRPRHQRARTHRHGEAAGRGAGRRTVRVASHLRRRLAADGAPGRQLRPDRRAEALPCARHLRRHSARGRHEGIAHHRRDQQGPRGAHLRDRRLRHRRRSVRSRAGADRRTQNIESVGAEGPTANPRTRAPADLRTYWTRRASSIASTFFFASPKSIRVFGL